MQFFHLLSFVGVASYAAALPQPAGLSEKYSNNVDITLASILKARSYQPVLDTREDLPTLMSLERRADSAGSPRVNSGSGTPPLSTLDYEEAKKLIYSLFEKSDFSFANIASTIDNVGDGFAELSENGEKVGNKIGGTAGDLLAKYVRRNTYNVEEAIQLLVEAINNLVKIFDVIKTLMSKSESGKTIYDEISTTIESLDEFIAEQQRLHDEIITALEDEFFQ
ncbi:hypothetical protein BASA50_007933 [Batrachochytrium salamandrivorans]|uniref:Uncharacterized protein n=1 Tax=Batrachochytrium salamandrivorans TaxID=1357716 RepID=A0ABQ8F8T8_9FUNG|nr:hypothetical protein BASA50_007933 [Batrachochytrium salamandrivorans]